ncbi:MAG: hypothetical protein ACK5PS_15235 [Desulfopila sp.]
MEKYTNSLYDDDLTAAADEEYDDSLASGDIDLFALGREESVISRLKSLVLSIDWEITDEVLLQFIEEINDLKDIWADEKIQMVYLQALEKIGKYIYQEKADAHPNSIRLLLSMYYNLERIVLADDLTAEDRKKLLLQDVQRFERLKKTLGGEPGVSEPAAARAETGHESEPINDQLDNLKTMVYGISEESSREDLLSLGAETTRLQRIYADSKCKMVFLQGLATLATYIDKNRTNAHADAFRLLPSFYQGLEKLVISPGLSAREESAILKPEIEKFNALRSTIAGTATTARADDGPMASEVEVPARVACAEEEDDEGPAFTGGAVTPAFADLPEESTHGFQEEVEARLLQTENPLDVEAHIASFFAEEEPEALADSAENTQEDDTDSDQVVEPESLDEPFFASDDIEVPALLDIDRETALQGVDVESEADDDSGEERLPVIGGDIAPALVDTGETGSFAGAVPEESEAETALTEEVGDCLDDLFAADEAPAGPVEAAAEEGSVVGIAPKMAFEDVETSSAEEAENEEEQFAELFTSLPDEEEKGLTPRPEAGEVADDVDAFFSLEDELEMAAAQKVSAQDGLFDLDVADEQLFTVADEERAGAVTGAEGPEATTVPSPESRMDDDAPVVGNGAVGDTVARLRELVRGLEAEPDEEHIQQLLTEIDRQQSGWSDRPLERNFLQLLGTVVRNTGQYRLGQSAESGPLLLGVMAELERAAAEKEATALEILCTSSGRVLAWQGALLASAVNSGDKKTGADGGAAGVPTAPADRARQSRDRKEQIELAAASCVEFAEEYARMDGTDIYTLRDLLQKEVHRLREVIDPA